MESNGLSSPRDKGPPTPGSATKVPPVRGKTPGRGSAQRTTGSGLRRGQPAGRCQPSPIHGDQLRIPDLECRGAPGSRDGSPGAQSCFIRAPRWCNRGRGGRRPEKGCGLPGAVWGQKIVIEKGSRPLLSRGNRHSSRPPPVLPPPRPPPRARSPGDSKLRRSSCTHAHTVRPPGQPLSAEARLRDYGTAAPGPGTPCPPPFSGLAAAVLTRCGGWWLWALTTGSSTGRGPVLAVPSHRRLP